MILSAFFLALLLPIIEPVIPDKSPVAPPITAPNGPAVVAPAPTPDPVAPTVFIISLPMLIPRISLALTLPIFDNDAHSFINESLSEALGLYAFCCSTALSIPDVSAICALFTPAPINAAAALPIAPIVPPILSSLKAFFNAVLDFCMN